MSEKLPLFVQVQNRTVHCIGGGTVAARRLKLLLEYGAEVTVVSPDLHEDLLKQRAHFTWEKRALTQGESFSSQLLFICTNNQTLNDELLANSWQGQWVYAAHDAARSDIHFPTVIDEGPVTLGVSTNGVYPAYTKKLKELLKDALTDANVFKELEILAPIRQQIVQSDLTGKQKQILLHRCMGDEFLLAPDRDLLLKQWMDELN
ncbi:precorrin-2 dehydrogenase/sirohydrochlorin ferrochelatase family protein [Alkalicoccobacillus porphyridii]|uniref:precorrin-2 dehydrogenase n=1 Tax=Alkalicoccobacillus porphyridii TaxID=2597270 RepID=A0A553ZYZ0_9BACI|nr:bifunctional precorrin-2 dehydrogenase/sirohydrochlorin ferrochelatase [Alkalicoccobacillus porphyridii]TSB46661.1 bifunctional precorrin-2 dehydrogenase/sirohydrochlorin ferrochelatase [Alkalicoccobacillus porphyridii]